VKNSHSKLSLRQDAFGASLLDYHLKGTGALIVERDDGLIEADSMGNRNYFAPFRRWMEVEKKAARLVKGRVLDVGCGAGRWCLEMQKRGQKATGIDNSPLAIETCRLRGVKDARRLSLEQAAALKPLKFDSIVMMGNNFGLLGGLAKARRILKTFHGLTTARARIFCETFDPYATHDPVHLAYHRRNRNRGRLGGQVRLRTRYRNVTGPWFDYLFAPVPEIKKIIRGTGWELERVIKGKGPLFVAVLAKRPPAFSRRRP
jgi:SAM-dependent methyltransferase